MGCPAVLIKGGHGQGAESIDYLVTGSGAIALAAPRIATQNTHGTGCSLSSAIAAGLAKGEDMETAVRNAKAWVSAAIAAADRLGVGHGHGPIHHFHGYLLGPSAAKTEVRKWMRRNMNRLLFYALSEACGAVEWSTLYCFFAQERLKPADGVPCVKGGGAVDDVWCQHRGSFRCAFRHWRF